MPVAPPFPATPAPIKIAESTAARVRQSTAGGYRGPAAGDGVNTLTRTAVLEYNDTADRVAVIEAFLKARAGFEPFFFPFEPGAVLTLVRCPTWQGPRTEKGPRRTLTVNLIEDHSVGYVSPGQPGRVTIDNTAPGVGETLTATLSDPDGSVTNLTWQWQRNGTDIAGATAAGYTVTVTDVGATLTAVASYDDADGTGQTATSAPTAAVAH